MPHPVYYLITMVVLFVAAGLVLHDISRSTARVYADLDKILKRARECTTQEELAAVRQELKDYHRAYCWNRHYGARAREILAYIDGRQSRRN